MLDKTKGLTSSEASRIKNFVKEIVKTINVGDTLQIVTSHAIRGEKLLPLDTNTKIEDWKDKLHMKARYYSLSSWLGEAIAYKEKLLKENLNTVFTGKVEGLLEIPEQPSKKSTSWEDFFSTLSVKEQSEYLTNDTYAAHIGKFIHNFDSIRNKFDTFEPTQFKKVSDTETLTVVNELLYTAEELISDVENLQGEHRKANKIVNYWKAKYKEWVANIEKEFMADMKKFYTDSSAIHASNRALQNAAAAEFEREKTIKREEIAARKIVVPHELQDIVDEVMEKFKG